MFLCFRKFSFQFIALSLMLSSCTARVPQSGSVGPEIGSSTATSTKADGNETTLNSPVGADTPLGERFSSDAEMQISQRSLEAWRTAIAHAKRQEGQSEAEWKRLQLEDEKAAMIALKELSAQYPTSSTIYLMMGQVEARVGKHKEAARYLRVASSKNRVNGLTLFKLAESERQSGDVEMAITHYRQLLSAEPQFYMGKIGLARCVIKDKPTEARQLAQEVLEQKPDDPVAIQAANDIMNETKGAKASK